MMEMKITVSVPDLAAAIAQLAAAVHLPAAIPAPEAPTPPPAAPVPPPAPAVPVNPTPAPVAPVAAPAAPTAPVPTEAPAAPVPTTAPTYTLDHISRAGASLVDAGKMEPLLALLGKYQVQAITQLRPDQYGAFATELRALGAQI